MSLCGEAAIAAAVESSDRVAAHASEDAKVMEQRIRRAAESALSSAALETLEQRKAVLLRVLSVQRYQRQTLAQAQKSCRQAH